MADFRSALASGRTLLLDGGMGTMLQARGLPAGEHPEQFCLDRPDVRILPVVCLSACNSGSAIALSGPGRWSYVYGGMSDADAAEILTGAAAYAAADDGIVPWRDRIAIFRKRSIARIPSIG